jgi:hypothetical protein
MEMYEARRSQNAFKISHFLNVLEGGPNRMEGMGRKIETELENRFWRESGVFQLLLFFPHSLSFFEAQRPLPFHSFTML